MVRIYLILIVCISLLMQATAQEFPVPTSANDRLQAATNRHELMQSSVVADIPFRSIGPTVFGGRITDVDVSPFDPTHFFVAYASGGLWLTTNNGNSFTPLFEKEAVMTIGDIAVNWQDSIIWVGTGEVNSSRSSYAGVGMYCSKDWGKTWEYKGLGESHHIGRIVIDPANPQQIWVAVLGHLYSSDSERGIFKSTDGGETWSQRLFVNKNAGAVDLVADPAGNGTLYAAIWERSRRAWNFESSGEGSGIFKSTDKGDTWHRLNTVESGFPVGEGVGRIGLDIASNDGQTTLYAVLDNNTRRPEEDKQEKGLTKNALRTMDTTAFFQVSDEDLEAFLTDYSFPKKYNLPTVKEMVRKGKIQPSSLVDYLEDANSQLFDTPVIGAEVYKSTDSGLHWEKTHEGFLDGVYYSYGYYFGQIRVQPDNPDQLYIMGVPILKSEDGGQTFSSINGDNVHADHHALWINPARAGHLILGNDGGINISYDNGETWIKCNSPAVGQFYAVAVDMKKPYNVYGGLQDNGVWRGPSSYKAGNYWHASGKYPYESIMGGDGMQIAVDNRDKGAVYTGYQFGNYYRIEGVGNRKYITPSHELGERPYRWNWQTPIHLSIHNQDILYMGAERVFRSFDKGEHFEAISEDLTMGGKKGNVPFGTLSSIHESPLRFGLIYTGSDDGKVYCSPDGGLNWNDISAGLPENLWVSRVQASQYESGRVYVTLNGYRNDHFDSYLYQSDNFGKDWKRIGLSLPLEPVNVIKEDPVNDQLLYVGTDHGLYVSMDGGDTFMGMGRKLPDVPVHDLVVHPRDKELIIGTHGRSLYVADVQYVQQMNQELLAKEVYLFEKEQELKYNKRWGSRSANWRPYFEPEINIPLYKKSDDSLTWYIENSDGLILFEETIEMNKGIQFITYHLDISQEVVKKLFKQQKKDDSADNEWKEADNGKWYLPAGSYTVIVETANQKSESSLIIKED